MKKKKLMIFVALATIILGCNNSKPQHNLTQEEQTYYLEKGKTIAQQSFGVLGRALKKSMSEKGVEGAVTYCSTKAFPLIDSLSNTHKATIRRTSLKVRNPLDKPSVEEMEALKYYETLHNSGQEIPPKVQLLNDGKVAFYAPIVIKSALCLNCHGKVGENISSENYKKIKELYPDDKAINYSINNLRGMWSIVFEKDKKTQ